MVCIRLVYKSMRKLFQSEGESRVFTFTETLLYLYWRFYITLNIIIITEKSGNGSIHLEIIYKFNKSIMLKRNKLSY